MRTIPAALAAHLATGATTLCQCWKIVRADGATLGFTDHDVDVSFDGVTFEAETGLGASAQETSEGLAIDNMSVVGALSAASLNEQDLAAGRFDGAAVELWRVNWLDPAERLLLRAGTLGEVARGGVGFTAEVRGLAHHLDQTVGRVYQHTCDANVGDARCGVDLNAAAYRGVGAVASATDDRTFSVSGLSAFAAAWFARGRLTWTSGANAGRVADVKAHSVSGATVSIELWTPMAATVSAGDGFAVTAGCDKRADTCKAKFANLLNFRGFPFMPGNDYLLTYPRSGGENDGGRRD
ncbi:MAG: DUF2163 domain-containing protein [Pseudomonadota bacterium]